LHGAALQASLFMRPGTLSLFKSLIAMSFMSVRRKSLEALSVRM
jgi:hypothetical protein